MSRRYRTLEAAVHGIEADWQAKVVKYAQDHKWRCIHIPRPELAPTSAKGYVDLTLFPPSPYRIAPNIVFRELKMQGGRLTKEQLEWGQHLSALGFDWGVWYFPGDWELVERLIKPEPWITP